MELVLIGNWLIVACCAVYLAWWSIAFNPMRQFPYLPKVVLFLITLGFGLTGIVVEIVGMSSVPAIIPVMPNWLIACLGIVLYIALLVLSNRLFRRTVTTELILIVGWLILQICAFNSLLAGQAIGFTAFWICIGIDVLAALIGLVCYLQYYRLPKRAAFFLGAVPLVLFGLSMTASNILIS